MGLRDYLAPFIICKPPHSPSHKYSQNSTSIKEGEDASLAEWGAVVIRGRGSLWLVRSSLLSVILLGSTH